MIRNVNIFRLMTAVLAVLVLNSCSDWFCKDDEKDSDDVLLLYSAGCNSLHSFLSGDFEDLKKGYVPGYKNGDDVLLVYMHRKGSDSPVLMRLFKDKNQTLVTDTLVVYEPGTITASAPQLRKVLQYVKDEFPARTYGMIFSSHATGWLPSGYYSNSDKYENGTLSMARRFSVSGDPVSVPYKEPEYDPSLPMTKSIGQDVVTVGGETVSYEIDLADFADAVPMYLDYILFDACLMGGVEVAYELRDVCGKVGFSQAEVLAEGLDYTTLTRHLFLGTEPMPEKVCQDYFDYYDAQTGVERSATISCVDCSGMEPLAQVCSRLFSKYADQIASVNPSRVQRYHRSSYHWFYDLESILVEAGITEEELVELQNAIDGCVIYKAATDQILGLFHVTTFSGFSMFLPCDGGPRLNEFYKSLAWNKATGLVR